MNKGAYLVLGVAAGSFFTWLFLKGKYEKLAQEEIESVKDTFTKKVNKMSELYDEAHEALKVYSTESVRIENGDTYVISPDEFGEFPDYNQVCVKYYEDSGEIVDERGEVLADVNGISEESFLEHFGEYEDDTVYYRDDMRCCDYEILKVPGSFSGEEE